MIKKRLIKYHFLISIYYKNFLIKYLKKNYLNFFLSKSFVFFSLIGLSIPYRMYLNSRTSLLLNYIHKTIYIEPSTYNSLNN